VGTVRFRVKGLLSIWFTLLIVAWGALSAQGVTIGAGPVIGTNKNPNVLFGSATWYEEFQDWTASDLRALDTNADDYHFSNGADTARDLVAVYSHDDGTNVYFRVDFFELAAAHPSGEVDVYVAIDCAAGGEAWLPDYTDTKTDHPWEVVVCVYDGTYFNLYDNGWTNRPAEYRGSYWRGDLDAVEFGISRSLLISKGWNGTAPLHLQFFTVRDGTNYGAGEILGSGSDLVDWIGTFQRGSATSNGWLYGGVLSSASAGRAKYAAIAHANQSLSTKANTQAHIFTDRGDLGLYPGFVRLMDSAEMLKAPVNLHISGTLLMSFLWATQDPATNTFPTRDGPTFLRRVKQFVTQGPGSLVGGVLAEHIMPYFEGEVNRASIRQNNELMEELFGLGPDDVKVMHVPERVFHTNTNSPYVDPAGPLKGRPFEDILAGGFQATYLDEVTHLHWWFYPNEQNNAGWDEGNSGRWAGGGGNDEEPYHHKVHKINGVHTFMINDREDQEKFGNDDGGMLKATRYTLLQKALHADYAQLTLVFDDWEAYAGNSFASSTPNNNADQWDRTIRWAANHPWIEIVNLKDVLGWAVADTNWVVDHGYVYDKSMQTYEWLKRAAEQDYDHWYYGFTNGSGVMEESFYGRQPPVAPGITPAGMKRYGDLNATGTLVRDSWDCVGLIAATNLQRLAEWTYSAMIYETAWHDENPPSGWPFDGKTWLAWPDAYKSRNYQVTFQRPETDSYQDGLPMDWTSGWALKLHAHVRDVGRLKAASDWVLAVRGGAQGPATTVYAADLDDDTQDEYVLCNDRVFLVFERWGARLVAAFVYDPSVNGGDAIAVVGAPAANPAEEHEFEYINNVRCSAFKDQYSTGQGTSDYADHDYGAIAPVPGPDAWHFMSGDGRVAKTYRLERGRDVVRAEYAMAPDIGTMYVRHGLGPNQLDLMLRGHSNLVKGADASYRGLRNTQGGAAYVVAGRNMGFVEPGGAGFDNRELPLVEQFETQNTATNWTVALAFSEATARDLDGDGLSNTNEAAIGTDHEKWDTDGDGMPDGYEIVNGLAATAPDAFGDLDEDGLVNWAEYVANTSASNRHSRFEVATALAGPAGFLIQHSVASGRHYQILYADSLAGSWPWQSFGSTGIPVGSYFEAGGQQVHTFTDDFTVTSSGAAPTGGVRTYTIRVTAP
jgi:hypothetical protein